MNELIFDHVTFSEVTPQDGDVLIVKGYANRFMYEGEIEIDSHGTSFKPTAFNLDNYKLNPVILYMHDIYSPIGKALTIKTTDQGLYLEAAIYKDIHKEAYVAAKNGVLNGFSIGIRIMYEEYSDMLDAFVVTSGELVEISLVTVPSNTKSVIENVDLCEAGVCTVVRSVEHSKEDAKRKSDLDKKLLRRMVEKALVKEEEPTISLDKNIIKEMLEELLANK